MQLTGWTAVILVVIYIWIQSAHLKGGRFLGIMLVNIRNIVIVTPLVIGISIAALNLNRQSSDSTPLVPESTQENQGGSPLQYNPLAIESLRQQSFPGSELMIEQTLDHGSNYQRYIVSYKSEGLKQFALLTVPDGEPPKQGWPGIIFNHGYIQPSQYRTTERYLAYTDAFSRNGYVLLRPDYRGHGNSEGEARGGYGRADYTIDVLNALASLQKYPAVNPDNIGMWGHSMGGWITQNAMVINPDIKAGVIWAGVVGSYQDLYTHWWAKRNRPSSSPTPLPSPGQRGYWRYQMTQEYGDFEENQAFWEAISATSYLQDISGPIQLHHAKGDETVPYQLSEVFHDYMQAAGQDSEIYLYEADNHNLTDNFNSAMARSITFFDTYLK